VEIFFIKDERSMKVICIIGSDPRSLINFRGELIKSFVATGAKVYALASTASDIKKSEVEALGVTFVDMPLARTSANPFKDLETYRFLKQFFLKVKPDIVLAYTIKPVIWSGIALKTLPDTRFYALITGLGQAFEGQSIKRKLLRAVVSFLYKKSLGYAIRVIFQNPDDLFYFVEKYICTYDKTAKVLGSGVPTKHFIFSSLPNKPTTFLMVARLLKGKGVYQYFEAAKMVKVLHPQVSIQILGPLDSSPGGLNGDSFQALVRQGNVEYLGEALDVRPFLNACHVFVLPSFYREGLPRSILEAMSIGRPVLTTNAVGCKETVKEGVNGFKVPVKSSEALAKKMIWFIENSDQIGKMGIESRKMAENKFDVHKVNKEMLKIMEIE
jgi:glycosyltransferase involved in cell wall biosynthesis